MNAVYAPPTGYVTRIVSVPRPCRRHATFAVIVKALANSVPKAGTHLLHACLIALPGMHDARLHLDLRQEPAQMRAWLLGLADGAVVNAHLVHEPRFVSLLRETRAAHLLMVRDPRDVVVSYAEDVVRATDHYLHEHFCARTPDDRSCLLPVWSTTAHADAG